MEISKGAKIRNWYNQVPHLTQDTNGKVTNSQIDTTNESQILKPSMRLMSKCTSTIVGYDKQNKPRDTDKS